MGTDRLGAALSQLQASSWGSSLLADPHLLVVGAWFPLHVSVVMLKTVIFYVWKTQQLTGVEGEGCVRGCNIKMSVCVLLTPFLSVSYGRSLMPCLNKHLVAERT